MFQITIRGNYTATDDPATVTYQPDSSRPEKQKAEVLNMLYSFIKWAEGEHGVKPEDILAWDIVRPS